MCKGGVPVWCDLTAGQWGEDLDQLVEAVQRQHIDLHHTVSASRFRSASRSLRERLPSLAGHTVVVELARLLAMIGDGHTALRLADVAGFGRFPVRLHRFSDGVFVRAIGQEHAALGGSRVISIGDTPIGEAWGLVRPLVSRDNEMGVWQQAPALLTIPEVLQALDVNPSTDQATWTVERPNGERLSLDLVALPRHDPDLVDARFRLRMADPLWLRRPNENWFEHLPEIGTLYMAYNTVRDDAPEPLAALFGRAFDLIANDGIDRFVLDIRRNGGGNMTLNWPLVDGLIRSERVNRWGHLFVIIGGGTFSAAMNLAVDLEQRTRSLFVGEPTGARPNQFGENADIGLSHSGLRATASALFWQNSLPNDDREWIVPDLPARLSSADYLGQRDPSFEAILAYEGGQVDLAANSLDRLLAKLARRSEPRRELFG